MWKTIEMGGVTFYICKVQPKQKQKKMWSPSAFRRIYHKILFLSSVFFFIATNNKNSTKKKKKKKEKKCLMLKRKRTHHTSHTSFSFEHQTFFSLLNHSFFFFPCLMISPSSSLPLLSSFFGPRCPHFSPP